MSIINQLAPVNSLVDGVANLVGAWRKPTLKSEDFASVLRERLKANNDPAAQAVRVEKMRNAVDRSSSRFVDLRDFDGDRMLTQDESGMEAKAFARLDANADGKLGIDELKKPGLDMIARLYPGASANV